jgi:hypothetical protein
MLALRVACRRAADTGALVRIPRRSLCRIALVEAVRTHGPQLSPFDAHRLIASPI